MNNQNRLRFGLLVLMILLVIFYFGSAKLFPPTPSSPPQGELCYTQATHPKCKNGTACMTNPSSTFCICMGGKSEIREKPEGQYGVCIISGNEIEEWSFFRSKGVLETQNAVSDSDIKKGWYWGSNSQKKIGTPDDWQFSEMGRSSCWHKPGVNCSS